MKKRFEMRRRVNRPIEIISSLWDEPLDFVTSDLSPCGSFVRSDLMPDMGSHIVCSFNLGSDKKFDFFGEIIRVNLLRRKFENSHAGFGIRFIDARPIDRIKIRDALRGNPPPVPVMRKAPDFGRSIVSISKPDNSKKINIFNNLK